MKILLLSSVLVAWAACAVAGPESLRFQFLADRDKDKEDMQDTKYGDGKLTVSVHRYKLRIENTGAEAVDSLQASLYVVAEGFDWSKETPLEVFNTQKRNDVKAEGFDTYDVLFDPVQLQQSLSKQGNTLWKTGHEMSGFVLEVTHQGKVVFTDSKGGSDVKKAVKAHKDKGDSKEK